MTPPPQQQQQQQSSPGLDDPATHPAPDPASHTTATITTADTTDTADTHPAPTPRYLAHTFSTKSCGASQHAEAERVAQSFRSCNFHSLQALPARLRPGGVEESRRQSINSGRSSKPENVQRPGSTVFSGSKSSGGLFAPLTYSRDEYNKVQKDAETRRQCQQMTALSFSRKPFTCASSRARLKNEDIFGDEKYRFPVLGKY